MTTLKEAIYQSLSTSDILNRWYEHGLTAASGVVEIAESLAIATAATVFNITCASPNYEYSQALPANCKGIEFQARGNTDLRWAWETGVVASPSPPYMTLKAAAAYDNMDIQIAAETLYLAAEASVVAEVIAWS